MLGCSFWAPLQTWWLNNFRSCGGCRGKVLNWTAYLQATLDFRQPDTGARLSPTEQVTQCSEATFYTALGAELPFRHNGTTAQGLRYHKSAGTLEEQTLRC
jgi:hypothetical protein